MNIQEEFSLESVQNEIEKVCDIMFFIGFSTREILLSVDKNLLSKDYAQSSYGLESILKVVEKNMTQFFSFFDKKYVDENTPQSVSDTISHISDTLLKLRDSISFLKYSLSSIMRSSENEVNKDDIRNVSNGIQNVVCIIVDDLRDVLRCISSLPR